MSMDTAPPVAQDRLARQRAYQALVGRLRDLIHGSVPTGATVVVVSKGDADLVSLVGRRGWHFPQDDSGGYAGYHPRDSASAIEGLEALRCRGADFLVIPATSGWWLEHYADFGHHLRHNYEPLVEQPDTGIIYTLRKESTQQVADDALAAGELEQHHRALLSHQINDLAAHLVPSERPVVVVDRGEVAPLQLDGRLTTHLNPIGSPLAAHRLAEGASLIAELESLRRQGAVCLIVARGALDWWENDTVFRSHVEQRYRCVTRQAHVCFIYELEMTEKAVTT